MHMENRKETQRLLDALDKDIDIKCLELKETAKEVRLRKVFFSSCLGVLILFLICGYFNLPIASYLVLFVIYQGVALSIALPLILSLNRKVV